MTHGSSDAPRRRRTLTSAGGGATSSSSRARSRSTGKSAGSPLRAPGGAGRKRVVELRRVHALHEPAPERGGSPLLGRLGPVVRLAEHGHKHKGHGDCTPFMGACGCTPIPEVYPPPQVVPPPLEQERHRLHQNAQRWYTSRFHFSFSFTYTVFTGGGTPVGASTVRYGFIYTSYTRVPCPI